MTVSVPSNLVRSYAGDGLTVNFSYPIRFDADDELVVVLRSTGGVDTTQTLGPDYTVSGEGTASGSVTFLTAPASGVTVLIYRATEETQVVDLEDAARNPAEAVELQMDRTIRMIQDHKELLSRSVVVRPGSQGVTLPEPSDGKFIGWNGSSLENFAAADVGGELLPLVADTIIKRNAANTAFEAKPIGTAGGAVLETEDAADIADYIGSVSHTNTFKRRKINSFPFYNATLRAALTTYSYDVLYPQSFALDLDAREIFILSGAGTGPSNRWPWVSVYDLDTKAFKTCFAINSSGGVWTESLLIREIGGVRYLETIVSGVPIRLDIDTLPSDGSVVTTATRFTSAAAFSWMTWDGVRYTVMSNDIDNPGNVKLKHRFETYDGSWNYIGTFYVPVSAVGTYDSTYIDALPKGQGIAAHNGQMYVAVGGDYRPPVSDETLQSKVQGMHILSSNGDFIRSSVCDPVAALSYMSTLEGRSVGVVETEGFYSAGGKLYGIWQTLTPTEWASALGDTQGVVLTEELAEGSDVVDFSGGAVQLKAPFDQRQLPPILVSGTQIKDPLLGTDLDSFPKVFAFMKVTGLSALTIYGTNQTMNDMNGASVSVSGHFINFSVGGPTGMVELKSINSHKLYWCGVVSGTQDVMDVSITTASGTTTHRVGSLTSNNPAIDEVDGVLSTSSGVLSFYHSTITPGYVGRPNDGTFLRFYKAGAETGSISVSGSTTAFNTTSDANLKIDKGELTFADAKRIILLVSIHNYDWKDSGETDIGAFAQELYEVYPSAVTRGGWFMPDDENTEVEEGTPGANYRPWQVDNSKLIPVIMRALQGLLAA